MTTKILLHMDNNFTDATGNYTPVQIGSGSLNYTVGKFSQGITNFDPYVRYLRVALNQSQYDDLFLNDFTIEFFHKNSGNGNWISLNNGLGTQFSLGLTGVNLTLAYGGSNIGSYAWVGSSYDDTNFHHYAITRSGNDFKVYIDGVAVISVTSANTVGLDTFYNFELGYGFYAGSVFDEFRFSDAVVYTSNFTPPTQPFILTTTPVIRARQTVGDKWIISLFAIPTNGSGVDAPIGSLAQVNSTGSGEIWFKYGSATSEWIKIQTGVDQDGWNVSYTLAGLDEVTADAYFGSSATAFDGKIMFARHGNLMMEFKANNDISLMQNTFVDFGLGKRTKIIDSGIHLIQDTGAYDFFINANGNEFQIDASNNLIVMRAMAIHERLDSANSFKNRLYNNHNGSAYEQMAHVDGITINNTVSNLTFGRVYGDYSNNDIVHGVMTFVARGTVDGNIGSVVYKKDYHIMNKQIIFDADSFSSQDVNADVADVLITDFQYSAQTFTVSVKTKKNTKSMTSTNVKVFIEEKVMNF